MKGNAIKKFNLRSLFPGILPLFILAHFGHHIVSGILTPLMPMIRSDLNLNYTQAGILLSAFALTGGISQLPAGWLADHIGPRIVVSVGISGVALAGVLIGLSQTYGMLIIFLVLMAALGGGYHPAATAAISSSVNPVIRGRALGTHLIGGSASNFLAPLLAAGIALVWGWRGSYITLAVPTIALGVAIYVLLGRQKGMKVTDTQITATTDSNNETQPAPHRLHRLILFLVLSLSIGALMHSVRAFIPLYMVDHFGVREEAAAAIIAIIPFAQMFGGPLGGYLSDRFGRIPVMLVASFLTSPLIYLLSSVPYGLGFGATLVIMGIINASRMPTSEAYLVSEAPARRRSTILGIYYFTGREIGGLLTPVMGYFIDRFGFTSSFNMVSAALLTVAVICSMIFWSIRDRSHLQL
ncbi:MFS transporter [Chloroflexota bacterium]